MYRQKTQILSKHYIVLQMVLRDGTCGERKNYTNWIFACKRKKPYLDHNIKSMNLLVEQPSVYIQVAIKLWLRFKHFIL
jgi:hypothetical protein